MADSFKLEIVTPERLLVNVDAASAQIPGKAGYLGILPQHTPLISELRPGTLEYSAAGVTEKLAVSWGYVEVLPERVSVLANTAEKATDIDVVRAEKAKTRAEERLRTSARDVDLDRATASLQRAMARLQTAKSR